MTINPHGLKTAKWGKEKLVWRMTHYQGGTHQSFIREGSHQGPTPYVPFYIPFLTGKVPLSYTFHWQTVPLSHTVNFPLPPPLFIGP